jgi:hypothetical protein
MKLLLAGLFSALCALPLGSHAQSCPDGFFYNSCGFGPNPSCIPGCVALPEPPVELSGPPVLCIREVCVPVVYSWVGSKAVAESTLPNGYEVLGWSGPCFHADRTQCPFIFGQAFSDLQINAARADRAQLFNPVE